MPPRQALHEVARGLRSNLDLWVNHPNNESPDHPAREHERHANAMADRYYRIPYTMGPHK